MQTLPPPTTPTTQPTEQVTCPECGHQFDPVPPEQAATPDPATDSLEEGDEFDKAVSKYNESRSQPLKVRNTKNAAQLLRARKGMQS